MPRAPLLKVPVSLVLIVVSIGCRNGFEPFAGAEDAAQDPPPSDGGPADPGVLDSGPVGSLACPRPDADTVALYTFDKDDGAVITDASGMHDGVLQGAPMTPVTASREGCGNAMHFPVGPMVHVGVADSMAWDLKIGSLDLWVSPTAEQDVVHGIISRDAADDLLPGHFALFQWSVPDGDIFVVRFQTMGDGGLGTFLCSDQPLAPGVWTHVGINFGEPGVELWVDGVRASAVRDLDVFGEDVSCNPSLVIRSIDGNDNPWGFGIDTSGSSEGTLGNPRQPFQGGAIDHVRISRDRRNFEPYRDL